MERTRNPRLNKTYNFRRVHGCSKCQGNCYMNSPKFSRAKLKRAARKEV